MYKALRVLLSLRTDLGRVRFFEKLAERSIGRLPERKRVQHLELAARLPEESMVKARLYPDREAMLAVVPKGGIVGEVGTWRGDFSRKIAEVCEPAAFHLFDVDFAPLKDPPGNNVFKHLGDSSANLASLPAEHFDMLYIDGDHSYEGVVRDLAAADRALKSGGLLMCNDYANWCSPAVAPYGVARAVNEFIIDRQYEIEGVALHPAGLPDILLRKPMA